MTVYKDCLGNLVSTAIISVFGSNHGKPGTGRLSLSTVSNCPRRQWDYTSYDVSDIVAEMDADGWDCMVDKDGYNSPRISCIHRATQSAMDALSQKIDTRFKNAVKGFIRFGKCPKNGKSFNHRDNIPEVGVSVFSAEFVGKHYRVLFDNHVLPVSYVSVADRPAYRIYGNIVGTGADGEPLLRVTKSVKL